MLQHAIIKLIQEIIIFFNIYSMLGEIIMKISKLIISIIMIILAVILFIKSSSNGLLNIFSNKNNTDLIALMMAFAYLIAGVAYLFTRS